MIIPIALANFEPKVRKVAMENNTIITLGPRSYLVSGTFDAGSVNDSLLIGRYSSLAHRLKFIIGLNHNGREVSTYPFQGIVTPPEISPTNNANKYDPNSKHHQIIIGNDVWIGADATVLGGVTIHNGAIIGAGAVISKDVPPYAVVVGNPQKIVKYRFSPEIIDKLQRIKWWNWSEEKIKDHLEALKYPETFVQKSPPPPEKIKCG